MTDACPPAQAEPPGIDADGVARWLAERDMTEPPLTFERIGHGRSNLTYRVRDARSRSMVLRRPPLGPLLESAHDLDREHRILSRLSEAGAPVPRPLAFCADSTVTGAQFFVMEHVAGSVLDRALTARAVPPAIRHAAGVSLASTLARIHALDVDAIGLGDLARRSDYAARQLRRWTRQWDASAAPGDDRIHRIAARLAAAIPPQREATVVHGDYRLDNVIVAPGGSVRAVLDWELCTLGDPLADLGLLVAYTPGHVSEVLPIHDHVMLLPGMPTADELVAAYRRASNRSLDALPYWIAFGLWKIAIILQGIHRRWLDQPTLRDPDVGPLEPAIAALTKRAELLVWERGW